MTDRPADPSLLDRVGAYLDAAPRLGADAEDRGPLTLFVAHPGGFPFYARPTLGWTGPPAGPDAVAAVRARQQQLGVPEAFEWLVDTDPTMGDACAATGLEVHEHPLLVLDDLDRPPSWPEVDGLELAVLGAQASDDDLAAAMAVPALAFAHPGTAIGDPSEVVVDREVTGRTEGLRQRLDDGTIATVLARVHGRPAAVASIIPVDDVVEVVGVGTVPAFRRQGLAAAATAVALDVARRAGISLAFLSAADDAVARIYEALGFRRAGRVGAAEPPATP